MDEIESGGLGRGNYAERFGGFLRPGGLAIDKLQLLHLVHLWSCAAFASGDGEDRLVFEQLRRESHGCTGAASVCVALDPNDELHGRRMEFMRARRGVRRGGQGRVEQLALVGPDSAWRGCLAVQGQRGIGDHYPVTPVFLRRVQGAVGRL